MNNQFPMFVTSSNDYQFKIERPFKNKIGSYTAMVQLPNGGRVPARSRSREFVVETAMRIGHQCVSDQIARGWLS